MRLQTVQVSHSGGRILACPILQPGGRKLLAKGHVLSGDDIRLLLSEGCREVVVTEFEEGEVPEDEAVQSVAAAMGCGSVEVRLAPGGRANLFATENCCVLVDDELLRHVNWTPQVVVATAANFSHAEAGQRIATVKSRPFSVEREHLDSVLALLGERGPMLQARPIRTPNVAILYTDPVSGDRAREQFQAVMRQRLDRFGLSPSYVLACREDEPLVAQSLAQLLRMRPTLVLVASTTAPAGPDDAVGRAMERIGAQSERYLAPVEPGHLFLLSYSGDTPVLSAPGCFRSAKPNVVDLVLPAMLSRYRISGWEIGCLGHGGLLG